MKQNKLLFDRPLPSDEELLKGKDFSAVLKAATPPWYKTYQGWGVATVAVVAGVGIFFGVSSLMDDSRSQAVAETNPVIQDRSGEDPALASNDDNAQWGAPIAELDLPFEEFQISPLRDTAVQTRQGSVLIIPSSTFRLENGKMATQDITLSIREFHDPLDMFRAGVPMEYDTVGASHLVSAGMLEIRASSPEGEVSKDFERPLDVLVVTDDAKGNYDQYAMRQGTGDWVFQEGGTELIDVRDELRRQENLLAQGPQEEVQDDSPTVDRPGEGYQVDIEFNANVFPELLQYQNIVFEIDRSTPGFKDIYFFLDWEEVELEREGKGYKVNLIGGDSALSFPVQPVSSEVSLEQSRNATQRDEDSRRNRGDRTAGVAPPRTSVYQALEYQVDAAAAKAVLTLKNGFSMELTSVPRRRMRAMGLGLINADAIKQLFEQEQVFTKVHALASGGETPLRQLYGVYKNTRTLYMNSACLATLKRNKPDLIWGVTRDGELAVASLKDCRKLKDGDPYLPVRVVSQQEGLRMLKASMDEVMN